MAQESAVESHVRAKRQAQGLSQGQLARRVGVTRQAISAMETGHYSPGTAVALKMAEVLGCRVEELFRLKNAREMLDGLLACPLLGGAAEYRAKLARVADRIVVWPMATIDPLNHFSIAADGMVLAGDAGSPRVKVKLFRESSAVETQVAIAGCDPAISLATDYLARLGNGSMFAVVMGSGAALETLRQGTIHAAGVHFVDEQTGECNLPHLRRRLDADAYLVVTFAAWQEGLLLSKGNPKQLDSVADLVRADVRMVNREAGSGARQLLDAQLIELGIEATEVSGYERTARSHFEVAWMVRAGVADAGVGLQSAALAYGLDFLPLRQERYDLVIPKEYFHHHGGIRALLDVLASGAFRAELSALGGYDTRETGKLQELNS